MPIFKVQLRHPDAKMPTKAHIGDAGWDLYSVEDWCLEAGQTKVFNCGIAIQLQEGFEAQIRGRSSLSKKGILCALGTIDEGFLGQYGVTLTNTSDSFFLVAKGDRIAQVVFQQLPGVYLVETKEDFAQTTRGEGGWGSSGK